MKNSNPEDTASLRQKAEEKLKERRSETNINVSEADKLKLIHELEVHQIELELQNEKLITAREKAKLAEAALEKTAKELAKIKKSADEINKFNENVIDTVREPLLAIDKDLRVIKASRSFYKFFKVTAEETIDKLIYELGNNQWDIPKLRTLLEEIIPEKNSFADYEVEHNFSTIGKRVMLLNARQVKRAFGKEKVILLAIEDITERKLLENLLTESEERFRRVFETADEGILLLEKAGFTIRYANQSITKLSGYSIEDCTGKKLSDIGFPADLNTPKEILQTLEKNGIFHYKDAVIRDKTGQLNDIDIYMVDKTHLVQCNIRDIAERKRIEKALLESEEKFRTITENSADAIFTIDKEGKYVYVNKQAVDLLGYSKEELLSYSIADISPKNRIEEYFQIFQQLVITGSSYFEIELVKKDGSYVDTDLNAILLPNGLIYGSCRDISERKKAEKQIKEDLKIKISLLQEIYHRTKNNMAIITAMLSMQSRRSDNEFVKTTFKELINRISSMSLVHEKLYKAKDLSSIDLKEYIEDLTKQIMQSYGRLSKTITVKYDMQEVKIRIDAAIPLGLIINELITNIFKHAFTDSKEGEIVIKLHKEKDETINLELQDNGSGFPQNFDPRKDASMGLLTVFSIVENQLDGEVSVKSENGLKWQIKLKDNLNKARV